MNEQLASMSAAITKAEISMKAATWQILQMNDDMELLRKCLFELAYTAEEHMIRLSDLSKPSQDTIVALRLGGFNYGKAL